MCSFTMTTVKKQHLSASQNQPQRDRHQPADVSHQIRAELCRLELSCNVDLSGLSTHIDIVLQIAAPLINCFLP